MIRVFSTLSLKGLQLHLFICIFHLFGWFRNAFKSIIFFIVQIPNRLPRFPYRNEREPLLPPLHRAILNRDLHSANWQPPAAAGKHNVSPLPSMRGSRDGQEEERRIEAEFYESVLTARVAAECRTFPDTSSISVSLPVYRSVTSSEPAARHGRVTPPRQVSSAEKKRSRVIPEVFVVPQFFYFMDFSS